MESLMARYQPGGKAQPKTSATKTYGRSKRATAPGRKHYPLMPDGLTVEQAKHWYLHRYSA
jgi:hypothetical protein